MNTPPIQDRWIAVGLFLLTLVSRIPFRSHILYHWDSVNFAFAIREFDVLREQPQPPGYILYVWLCRWVDLAFHDAQTTMVAISIVASALAVVTLFYLGRSMFDRRVGLTAALFLATSPLFWFYGEIALPHTLDTLLVLAGAWWLYEVMQGKQCYLYPAVVVLAVAGGIRQQTLIFLLPLTLLALHRVGWKRFVAAGALGAAICTAWFIPLTVSSGGLASYWQYMGAFSQRFQETTSILMGAGWSGIKYNLTKLVMYTLYGWSMALLPTAGWVLVWLRRRPRIQLGEKPAFLFLWVAPALLFYTLIHMGQQGLIFVFLPVLLLVAAAGLTHLLNGRNHWLLAALLLAASNAAIFCRLPEYPLGPGTQRLLTRDTLVNSDHYYQDRFKVIEEHLPPQSTVILAANWHHVEYYLPEYVRLPARWAVDATTPPQNSTTATVTAGELGLQGNEEGKTLLVIFDPVLLNSSPATFHSLPLEHGGSLDYVELAENQTIHYGNRLFIEN